MCSAFDGIDIIYIRINMFAVTVIIDQGNLYGSIIDGIQSVNINRLGNQWGSPRIVIQHFQKFRDTTLAVKCFCIKLTVFVEFTKVIDDNSHSLIEER